MDMKPKRLKWACVYPLHCDLCRNLFVTFQPVWPITFMFFTLFLAFLVRRYSSLQVVNLRLARFLCRICGFSFALKIKYTIAPKHRYAHTTLGGLPFVRDNFSILCVCE